MKTSVYARLHVAAGCFGRCEFWVDGRPTTWQAPLPVDVEFLRVEASRDAKLYDFAISGEKYTLATRATLKRKYAQPVA